MNGAGALDTCGCCGLAGPAGACGCPPAGGLAVRPGLPAIPYRVGTHGSFLAAMKAAIHGQAGIRALAARDAGDPAIALLDATATVLDVLTFYQERIANEGYLRTATELESVQRLGAEIGYVPRPGVAASTFLAFQAEDAPGAPAAPVVGAGTRVQSVPGPGQQPQTFETIETITARPRWNRLRPRLLDPSRQPQAGDGALYVRGGSLRRGDRLLVVYAFGAGSVAELRTVAAVTADTDLQVTRVELDTELCGEGLDHGSTLPLGVYALRQKAALFGSATPPWRSMSALFRAEYARAIGPSRAFETGRQERVFDWPEFTISGVRKAAAGPANSLYLDAAYPLILPGSWVVLVLPQDAPNQPGCGEVFQALAADLVTASDFTLSAQVSRLVLDCDPALNFDSHLRDTAVYAQSEPLTVAWPDLDPVAGARVTLSAPDADLAPGQALAFGRVAPDGTVVQAEVGRIAEVDNSDPTATTVRLERELQGVYDRRSLEVSANVARATHGESRTDVLGSGDGSQAFQRFDLRQSPLTYVQSTSASGAESTLQVSVSGAAWQEVATLVGRGPRDRVYVTHREAGGPPTLEFGDGATGARLPTGVENVVASYRVGVGAAGNVDAGQLTLLLTRPLGIRAVRNPVTATGGTDAERIEDARRNAPLTVLTFDRVVSLQDFEDFAAAFAGVAMARAAWLWDGRRRVVHVTVAAAGGRPVDPNVTGANLVTALGQAGDGRQNVVVQSLDAITFHVRAGLYRDPAYAWPDVRQAATSALQAAFSAGSRRLAQPVTESEVMAVLQAVPGVAGVRLTALAPGPPARRPRDAAGSTAGGPLPELPALPARIDPATRRMLPDQLLTLAPEPDGARLWEAT